MGNPQVIFVPPPEYEELLIEGQSGEASQRPILSGPKRLRPDHITRMEPTSTTSQQIVRSE